MKKSVTLLLIIFIFSNANASDPIKLKSKVKPKKVLMETAGNIGVEKGQRKNCPPGTPQTKICCDRKFCLVTPKSSSDEDVKALNYFEGTIEKINEQFLAINIPYNKILPGVYSDWFINVMFEGEYFPLDNSVAQYMGLQNIALSAGNYPVVRTNEGFRIVIKYQSKTGE
jgi:hypothetical protein